VAALQAATRTVPIVFAHAVDPVGAGFVDSLARPGGNATGFVLFEYGISAKWLELLKEIAPALKRVAVLRDPTTAAGMGQFGAIQSVAPSFGMEVNPVSLRDPGEIERGITAFAASPNGGLIITAAPLGTLYRELIIALAARHKLPAIYSSRFFAADGGLVYYGPDLTDQYRRAAGYIDRILKGEKPANLAVQAPTKYEMAIIRHRGAVDAARPRRRGVRVKRREFITLLGGAAAAWPGAVWAQQSATKKNFPTVGWLVTGSPTSYRHSLAAFRDGLTEAGYLEGQNIRIEYRWAEGNVGRLPELARDLVHQQVDVILAGGSVGAEAAKRATSIIPIVAAGVGDLVELGLVGSLARPNGNLTGFIAAAPETAAKRFQMVKEIKPEAKRAAVLWNSNGSNAQLEWKVAKEFADANGLTVILYDARDVPELTDSLARIKQSPPDVLVNLNDPFLFTARKLVVDSVREMRVPGVYGYREYAEDGGLISYGTNIADTYRSAARYVDKIFKGVQPADLPVQLPTKYELIINLKTAKALGLEIPPTLLARADEVIE